MDGGLGGANGFIARTRTEQDAKAFVKEFRSRRPRSRDSIGTVTIIVVSTLVLLLGTLLLVDLVG